MKRSIWNLHLENNALRAEIRQARATIRRLEERPVCAYCGHPCQKGRRVCVEHADLPAIDAGFAARTEPMFADCAVALPRVDRGKVAA